MATGDRQRSARIAPQARGTARAPQDVELNTTGENTQGRQFGCTVELARTEGQLRGLQADLGVYNAKGRVHRFLNEAPTE